MLVMCSDGREIRIRRTYPAGTGYEKRPHSEGRIGQRRIWYPVQPNAANIPDSLAPMMLMKFASEADSIHVISTMLIACSNPIGKREEVKIPLHFFNLNKMTNRHNICIALHNYPMLHHQFH